MSLADADRAFLVRRFPRVSGDEPEVQLVREVRGVFSPRERG